MRGVAWLVVWLVQLCVLVGMWSRSRAVAAWHGDLVVAIPRLFRGWLCVVEVDVFGRWLVPHLHRVIASGAHGRDLCR